MGLVQVIIDDSTDKIITGVFVFDRDNGGVFKVPHGSSFPASPLADEMFWKDGDNILYKRNGTNTAWVAVSAAVALHATTHRHGGTDEVATGTPGANAIPKADGSGKVDSWVTSNAVAGTPSLRQLGTGATDACAGNDSRLSDARTPSSHATSHQHGGSDQVATATPAANAIPKADGSAKVDAWVTANAVGGTPSLRQLGTGATDACAGNDSRLSDSRTPTAHATTHRHGGTDEVATATPAANAIPKADSSAKVDGWVTANAAASVASLRKLGTGNSDACAGDDARLSNARTPTVHASSHELGGTDVIAHQSLSGAGVRNHATIDSHLDSTSNPHSTTASQVGLGNVTNDAQLKRAAGDFATFTEKAAPVSADLLLIEDSAAAGAKKKVQVGNLPGGSGTDVNAIHKNVAAEISTIAEKVVPFRDDLVVIEDSEASNAKKRMKIGNLVTSEPYYFNSQAVFFDEFYPPDLNPQWTVSTSGTGSLIALQLATGGQVLIRAGNAAARFAELYFGGGTAWQSLSTSPKRISMRAKYGGSVNGRIEFEVHYQDANNYVFLRGNWGENWFLRTCSGGVETAVDTGIALDTSWHVYRIDTALGRVDAYIDGVLRATSTTNIPTSVGTVSVWVYASGTGGAKDFLVDGFHYLSERAT